jgi:molybdate transport system ATP-binding protein
MGASVNTLFVSVQIKRGNFTMPVDLQLPVSGITAFLGASGTGKTSLLRAIAGLDAHAGATVRYGGKIWQDASLFVPTHERQLGYVFQEDNLFPHLSVLGNLRYATQRCGATATLFDHVVQHMELETLLPRQPLQLSGGEKQKVAVARALLSQPTLLLMDEPLAALDEDFKRSFLPQFKQLIQELGIPVLYISHSSAEIVQLADTLVYFSRGLAPVAAPTNELLTNLQHPLAQRADAEALLEAEVKGYEAEYGLYTLDCGGIRLLVGGAQLQFGQRVRLRILAQDVSVTLTPPQHSSILNILPATVLEISPCGPTQHTVLMRVGGQHLLARITRKSTALLQLQANTAVYAQIKSVAVLP